MVGRAMNQQYSYLETEMSHQPVNKALPDQPLSSVPRTLGNIVISFVGAGMLGLPYAFLKSGLLTGVLVMMGISFLATHCMLLLVQSRQRIEGDRGVCSYNELAGFALGPAGKKITEWLLIISQVGFCVAYLVFIGTNLGPILGIPKFAVILILMPVEVVLALVRSLTALAPFSLLADFVNIVAVITVFQDDVASFSHRPTHLATGFGSIPFIFGVAIYCYEGMGLVLPLEAAMKDRRQFPGTLMVGIGSITSLFIAFGVVGYEAFGDSTHDIITLNLPHDWTSVLVKASLCFGLTFTYPVMMVPVYEIIERNLLAHPRFEVNVSPSQRGAVFTLIRIGMVSFTATVASAVPGFGTFISLIGSSCCAALAFVLPPLINNKICGDELSRGARLKNNLIMLFGFIGAIVGTVDTVGREYFREQELYYTPPPPLEKLADPVHGPTVRVPSQPPPAPG